MEAAGNAVCQVPSARWTLGAEANIGELSSAEVAAVSYGGNGKVNVMNLPRLVNGLIEAREAELEESLGVQRQLVWDVESTAQAPLGELKFTPYPTEKRRTEWRKKELYETRDKLQEVEAQHSELHL